MEQKQSIKIRRIGTLTFGCMMILFGALSLIHVFVPQLDYRVIFRCWPCILIALGIEVLVGNYKMAGWVREGQQVQFIYDKTAIFLTAVITFFAMAMAAVDFGMQCILLYGDECMRF